MANTHDRRIVNPPIRFRYDLDPIDRDPSPCPPPANDDSSTLPGSTRPVSVTYFQWTDVCPLCQTSNHRKSGRYYESCDLFYHPACLPASASRRPNPQASARGYANAVYSMNMQPSLPFQQHLLLTNICRMSWNSPSCVDNADTNDAIRFAKSSTAIGPNMMSTHHLTKLAHRAISHLTNIFNLTISTGQIPEIWHKAIIIPILMPGKDDYIGKNWRPIILLCLATKMLEKLLLPKILTHIYFGRSTRHAVDSRRSPPTLLQASQKNI